MQNRPMKSATALTSQPWRRLNVRLPLWALGLQKEKPETDKPEFLRSFWWFLPEAIKPWKKEAQTPRPGPQNSTIWPQVSVPACSPTLHVLGLEDAQWGLACAFPPLHFALTFLLPRNAGFPFLPPCAHCICLTKPYSTSLYCASSNPDILPPSFYFPLLFLSHFEQSSAPASITTTGNGQIDIPLSLGFGLQTGTVLQKGTQYSMMCRQKLGNSSKGGPPFYTINQRRSSTVGEIILFGQGVTQEEEPSPPPLPPSIHTMAVKLTQAINGITGVPACIPS